MRALIVVLASGLAVSACGSDQTAENTINIDATATADDIASNDTTAIDAATGDDAQMAADVNYTLEETNNLAADENAADNAANNAT